MMSVASKHITNPEILRLEYRPLISALAEESFLQFIKEKYVAEVLAAPSRHMPGGWPLEEAVMIVLHWICKYPVVSFYATRHNFPGCDVANVVGRVLHLCEGWADLHILPSTPEERVNMQFSPPLPADLLQFSNATLFSDGVEYARTKKNIHSEAAAKEWWAFKLKGYGWRVMVPTSNFPQTFLSFSALAHTLLNSLPHHAAYIQPPRGCGTRHRSCPRRRRALGREGASR
jgi:hypothetical protein